MDVNVVDINVKGFLYTLAAALAAIWSKVGPRSHLLHIVDVEALERGAKAG